MKCIEIQDSLSAYIDGILDSQEIQSIEDHLKECLECQRELSELRETMSFIASLPEEIPPARFRRELREKLDREVNSKFNKYKIFSVLDTFTKKYKKQLPIVATALLLIIVIVPVILSGDFISKSKMDMALESSSQSGKTEIPQTMPLTRGQQNLSEKISFDSAKVQPSSEPRANVVKETSNLERKIIRTAFIRMDVDYYKEAINKIKELTISFNGYITNQSDTTLGEQELTNGSIEVKIPVEVFEQFLDSLANVGIIQNRNINSQDVTEEYFDIESQLRTYRVKETRLLTILEKTGELKDILAVENELANTRAQLEQLEGRLRYLSNRTDFSTANIDISQLKISKHEIKLTGLSGVFSRTKEGFIRTINSVLTTLGDLIVIIGSFIPILVILGIIVGIVIWGFKKYNKK